MDSEWTYPGARWWKFDFHTHTPASKDTDAWQKAIGTPEELTPQTWLRKYMEAEIDCVAITDHNSGDWVDRLKEAYVSMQSNPPPGFRPLYLFPGVELSINSGFHLLAIFDISATTRDIVELLAKVDYKGTDGDSDGVTSKSATEVVRIVLDAGALPIPAHVDNPKGLFKIDSQTREQVLDNPGILAMEVMDRSIPKPGVYAQKKIRWAEILGSDTHTFQGPATPGSRFTWVKMASPSLEGLRLALLDGQEISIRRSDDPVAFSPFDLPEHFIESVEISEARAMGRKTPAVVAFNPYFNALVGGRGTGKSTIVHALRLAYRREDELAKGTEAGETFLRFKVVAKDRKDRGGLRSDTKLTLTLNRDGERYRLQWRQNGEGYAVEEWDAALENWKPSISQYINEQRFPVRLFSQGQIADLAGEDPQALLEVIDKAAGTAQAHAAFNEAKTEYFATKARLREIESKLKSRESVNIDLQDVQRKLARFEVAHHAEVLRVYQRSSRQSRELERQFDTTQEQIGCMLSLADDLLADDLPEGLFDSAADTEALSIVQKLAHAIGEAKSQIETAAKTLETLSIALKSELMQGAWQIQAERAKTDYETLKTSLQEQGISDPSEYGRLVQERQGLDTESKRLDALQKQYTELEKDATEQRNRVWESRREISAIRNRFLQKVLADNCFVRIILIQYGREAQAIERSLRELLDIATDKFKDDIYVEAQEGLSEKGLIADLLSETLKDSKLLGSEEPDGLDKAAFEGRLQSYQERLVKACLGSGDFSSRFNKYLADKTGKLPEFIDSIFCWFPEDGLQIQYSRKGDGRDFQSIGQASAGQRAAAMLAFLLAYGKEPLVLDQPEDDLDNHLIYELVVQQIRANKQRRQLIIVTHNPNIVVNGDAEMIHALDFNGQCHVKQSGSLQDDLMRGEVCKIMEGGKDAFERRYRRLGREV